MLAILMKVNKGQLPCASLRRTKSTNSSNVKKMQDCIRCSAFYHQTGKYLETKRTKIAFHFVIVVIYRSPSEIPSEEVW